MRGGQTYESIILVIKKTITANSLIAAATSTPYPRPRCCNERTTPYFVGAALFSLLMTQHYVWSADTHRDGAEVDKWSVLGGNHFAPQAASVALFQVRRRSFRPLLSFA